MFPSLAELRERAWKDIESARLLLDSDPDRAAYLAGYSLELMLKGRYAALRSWSDYPERPEITRRGAKEVLDHRLDNLLKLAQAETLKNGAMLDIDWGRASSWDVAQRYTPPGTLARDKVSAQIDELEKVYHQVVDFMVLDKLVELESSLTEEFGLFNFFAYVRNARTQGWELWYAVWARPNGPVLLTESVEARLDATMDPDLRAAIGHVQAFHPEAPGLRAFYAWAAMAGGLRRARMALKQCLVIPFGFLPDTYVITCGRWAPELLHKAWAGSL